MRTNKSIRRGLFLWFGHCRAIMDDKEEEFATAQEEGEETEYTAQDMKDLQAALNYMFENGESGQEPTNGP